ncbi:MAG: phosphoglycerate kinase, partial [Oscillospiraceae bacterium]|nr:phosphoglycerate kinase [Oscillospiraceae bacterium]
MNYNKKSIKDVDVKGKKLLLRCDFNVPRNKETGEITSDKRIVASLPTIKYLLENGARVIACSHMGKPKGEFKKELSLAAVATRLSELLDMPVGFAPDVAGEETFKMAANLNDGEIMLFENVRFDAREEKNDPEFSQKLAALGEV